MTETQQHEVQLVRESLEHVAKAAEASKDLSEIRDAIKLTKKFGQLTAAATFAGIGFDIVLMFLPQGPSPDEVIMEMIEELSGKIDGLWADMDVKFKQVHEHIDLNFAKSKMRDHIQFFRTLQLAITRYRQYTTPQHEANVRVFIPQDILTHLEAIRDLLLDNDVAQNVLQAQYESTKGNVRTIVQTGMQLYHIALFAPMAYALTCAIRHKKSPIDEPEVSRAEVERDFQPLIEANNDAVTKYTDKCSKEAKGNIKDKLNELLPSLEIASDVMSHVQYRKPAETICKLLADQWFWLDFLVIVGQPTSKNSPNIQVKPGAGVDVNEIAHIWLDQRAKPARCSVLVAWTEKKESHSITFNQFDEFMGRNRIGRYDKDRIRVLLPPGYADRYYEPVRPLDKIFVPSGTLAWLSNPQIGWNVSWTNSDAVGFVSYHGEWLTAKQQKEIVQNQIDDAVNHLIWRVEANNDAVTKYTDKRSKEAKGNIKDKLNEMFPSLEIASDVMSHVQYRKPAETICKLLADQWPWLDFLVIVGQPTSKNSPAIQVKPGAGVDVNEIAHIWLDQRAKPARCSVLVAWTEKKESRSITFNQFDEFMDRNRIGRYDKDRIRSGRYYEPVRPLDKIFVPSGTLAWLSNPQIGWNVSWTNSDAVGFVSYHGEWLTAKQQKEIVQNQIDDAVNHLIWRVD